VTPGDTFRFNDPRDEPHLWIILSDPGRVAVIVSASTKSLGLDLPIIEPGEYPSLSRRSFVRCDKARLVPAEVLQQTLDRGVIRESHPLPPGFFARVRAAVLASEHTPGEVKEALQPARPPSGR
jgi:hypothetical protein